MLRNLRKNGTRMVCLLCLCMVTASCGHPQTAGTRAQNGKSVQDVINEQIDPTASKTGTEAVPSSSPKNDSMQRPSDTVDYDLTAMSGDMVYATVLQMMTQPDTYLGKSFKMQGTYYSIPKQSENDRYHFCIIADATACCSQGMEFIWEQNQHIYPDEYPAEKSVITVTGVFETYREDGDSNLYCRLTNAQLYPET